MDVCVCGGVCTVIWEVDIWMDVCVEVYMHRRGRFHTWMDVCVEVYA